MNISDQLHDKFTALRNQSIDSDHPAEIVCPIQTGTLACELTGLDAFACQIQEIVLQCPDADDRSPEELAQLSESLAARLHYLLEPIVPIEFDREAAISQLRSNPPAQDELDGRSYYELLAVPGRLEMRRFLKQPRSPRQRTVMTFTREVFGRLASDMVATLAEFA